MLKKIIQIIIFISTIFFFNNCTEPHELESNIFEDVLVVEATITNEFKNQEINISRTSILNKNSFRFEVGATVKVIASDGVTHLFQELNQKYVSTEPFEPRAGISYQLFIKTANGKNYTSTPEILTAVNEIESVTATAEIKDGIKGVQIRVNSHDASNSSKYYRYTYDETYKVIVPKWSPNKLEFNGTQITILPREGETQTCYKTNSSTDILITNTVNLNEDQIVNYPIRFIPQKDYILSNRYSIIVKQYIQNLASYKFYENLKKTSTNDNLLSQNQPGFFFGNLKCVEDQSEKVIGFFDLATISSKRIFFNYDDIFPGELFPEYFDQCEVFFFDSLAIIPPTDPRTNFWALKTYYETGRMVFYYREGQYYYMVKSACGDCTSFASNVIPDFWE